MEYKLFVLLAFSSSAFGNSLASFPNNFEQLVLVKQQVLYQEEMSFCRQVHQPSFKKQ